MSNVFEAFGDELALNTFSEILDRLGRRGAGARRNQRGGGGMIDLTDLDAADSMHDFGKNDARSASCPNEINTLILKAHGKKQGLGIYGFPFYPGYSEADFKRLYIIMNSYRVLPLITVYKDIDPMSKLDKNDPTTDNTIVRIANHLMSDMRLHKNHTYMFDAYSGSLNSAVRNVWNSKNVIEITPLPKRVDPSTSRKNIVDNSIDKGFADLYTDIYSSESIRIDKNKTIDDITNLVGKNSVKELCGELSNLLASTRSTKNNTNPRPRQIKWVLDKKRIGDHGMVNFCATANARVGNIVVEYPPLFSFDNMCNVYSFEKNSPCIYNSYDVAAQRKKMEDSLLSGIKSPGMVSNITAIMNALKPVQYFSAFKGVRGKVDAASLQTSYQTIVSYCETITRKIKRIQGIDVQAVPKAPRPVIANNNTITVYLVQRGAVQTHVVELHENPLDIDAVLMMASVGLEVLYTPPSKIDFSDARSVSSRFEMLSKNVATLTHVSNILERFESDVKAISSALVRCILLAPSVEYVPANPSAYNSARQRFSLRQQESNKRTQLRVQVETAMRATAFVKLLRKYLGDVRRLTSDRENQQRLLRMLCKHSSGVQQFVRAVKETMRVASMVGNADNSSRLRELQNLVDTCNNGTDENQMGGNTAVGPTMDPLSIMDIMLDDMLYL